MDAKRVWKREEEVCQCDRNTHLFSKCAKCIQTEEAERVQEQADKAAEAEAEPTGDVEAAEKSGPPAEEQPASTLEGTPFLFRRRWQPSPVSKQAATPHDPNFSCLLLMCASEGSQDSSVKMLKLYVSMNAFDSRR